NQRVDYTLSNTHWYTCTTRVPWQRGSVILRLKEFAVDYFWTEAGGFGKERPGHFEDLTSSSSHCLPKAPGAPIRDRSVRPPATDTHADTLISSLFTDTRLMTGGEQRGRPVFTQTGEVTQVSPT
ncbi:hypothetical protein KUCAC02_006769, partial [Chaenocephalus aceratus]